MQGAGDRILEQRGYCMETDPDGDQVFWKVTPSAHQAGLHTVLATHEAIAGTGKYAGVSMTITSTCDITNSGPTYAAICVGKP